MTPIHLHLMLNHIPVLGTVFACLLLLYAIIRGQIEIRKVALGVFILVGLITPVVFFSGDNSVDPAKNIPGVREESIETHDEAAEIAFGSMVALGVLSLAQLILFRFPARAKLGDRLALATLVLSAIAFVWVAHTANLGAQIRHGQELGVIQSNE
jgi:hypothetical protein